MQGGAAHTLVHAVLRHCHGVAFMVHSHRCELSTVARASACGTGKSARAQGTGTGTVNNGAHIRLRQFCNGANTGRLASRLKSVTYFCKKWSIVKKNLKISSKIVRHRVDNNVFCSLAQTTCWISVGGIYENFPRWTTYESPSIYSRKTAILLCCNTLMWCRLLMH